MIQISRKSIRLGMAALYSRYRLFSPHDFSCNTSQLYQKKKKKHTGLVFSTGSVGNPDRRSVRTRIVLKQDIYTQNHPR